MVENRRREHGGRSLSRADSRLKIDFVRAFCSKCKQLRGSLKCYLSDIEKCIIMLFSETEEFVSMVMEPVILPFCSTKCISFNKCGFYKRRHIQKDVNRLMFQCFFSIKTETLGRAINLYLIRPNNALLPMACDRNIDDVFLDKTKEVDTALYETVSALCDGDIGTLTEIIMSSCRTSEIVAGQHEQASAQGSSPFFDVNGRREGYLLDHSNRALKPLKKEFFFKEKIL